MYFKHTTLAHRLANFRHVSQHLCRQQRQWRQQPPLVMRLRCQRPTVVSHLVSPDAGEDVVELDVDGAEGQEACHHHLWQRCAVPRQGWDVAWVLGGPAEGLPQANSHRHPSDEAL